MIESDQENILQRLKREQKERKAIEDANKAKVLFVAISCFTGPGYNQLTHELRLRTVRLTNQSDPLLAPLLRFYNRYFNNKYLTALAEIDLKEKKGVEVKFLEVCRPRIEKRLILGLPNPISLPQWEAELHGQPLDLSQETSTVVADYANSVEFQPSQSLLAERNS